MNKQVDFENDLAALHENVNASVGDVLEVLQQKRGGKRPEPDAKPGEKLVDPAVRDESANASAEPIFVSPPRRQRTSSRSRLTPTIEREEPLENVTTRLRQKTNELLTEAALRQRLKKETPSTRQDIIEAALGDWFQRYGYGRAREDSSAE
ncbi:MAG: hypothetical protein JNL18_05985 [Planctomycetaceae bacterium]|jgi:hypothetical protein|nr:hypothetical protein [Planctomycetaceae bacterium]